jgi:hypothetical protein
MAERVFGLKRKIWWKVYLSLLVFCFILMVGTLASKSWAYTTAPYTLDIISDYKDVNNNLIDFRFFEGNLYRCTVSCTETYKKLSKEYCDALEKLIFDAPEDYFACFMFKNLNKGMKSYLVCECFAMFLMFISGVLLVITIRKRKVVITYIVYGLLTLTVVSHYTGFISWMSITNTNFNRNCVDPPNKYYSYINLCAGDGPALSLFIAIILPLLSVSFCFVSFNLRSKKNKKNEKEQFELKVVTQLDHGVKKEEPKGVIEEKEFNEPSELKE